MKHRAGISGLGKIHFGLFTGGKDFRLFANGIPLTKKENRLQLWGTIDFKDTGDLFFSFHFSMKEHGATVKKGLNYSH